jgi:hypothetical protein
MLAGIRLSTLLCAPGSPPYAKLPERERERVKHAY